MLATSIEKSIFGMCSVLLWGVISRKMPTPARQTSTATT
jgi:hypothetical protein